MTYQAAVAIALGYVLYERAHGRRLYINWYAVEALGAYGMKGEV